MRLLSLVALAWAVMASAPLPPGKPRIHLPVWAGDGRPLKPGEMAATLNGQPARVLEVRAPESELLLVLVLDFTEDLAWVEPAKEALVEHFARVPEGTRVAVMRAQDGLSVIQDPTADPEAIAAAIRGVPVSGKAGLLEAVEAVAQLGDSILTRHRVRTAVLFVTDSDIYNYREDFTNPVINTSDSSDLSRRFPEALIQDKIARLKERLSFRQTPLFVVHLRYRNDRLNEAYQNGLKQLAEVMGGSSDFCRTVADIPASVGAALERIRSHYSVTLEVAEKPKKALEIDLKVNGGERTGLVFRRRLAWKRE